MATPLWLISLILMTLMTATNLFSVSSFGEFEFWFAGIKVAAICAFLVIGGLFVVITLSVMIQVSVFKVSRASGLFRSIFKV